VKPLGREASNAALDRLTIRLALPPEDRPAGGFFSAKGRRPW
jgi:hypothetical protein